MAAPEVSIGSELDRNQVAPPDPASIMLIAAALVGIGVVMIYSASASVAGRSGQADLWKDPGLRQLYFVPPALGLMWLASRLPYSIWRLRRRWPLSPCLFLFLIALGLLAAVLAFGPTINGAKRWFRVGPAGFTFNVQPSELGKLALVVLLAALLADSRYHARRFWRGLLPLVVLSGAVIALVIVEDFGTAFLIAVVAACMLLAGGTRIAHLVAFVPPAAGGAFLFVYTSSYRWERVKTWLSGGGDPQGAGYHIKQSLLTIASGSWFGRGLGDGIQKFEYLPEDTTDFIFAILCEELGLVGAFIVIGLFLMLLWQLRRAIAAAPDLFGQLLVLGVALTIGFQAAMNIAVVTDSVPTKGIGLPFVSAGGSGLIVMSVALGLAAAVARAARRGQVQDRLS